MCWIRMMKLVGAGWWITLELGENGKMHEAHHIIRKWYKITERTAEFEITGKCITKVRTTISRTTTTGKFVNSELSANIAK